MEAVVHNASRHLIDVIKQESYLPEIDGESCIHAVFDNIDCQACVDTCPTQAWVLGEESLGLDTEACDGCGLCVPACPSGAIHVNFPWVIRWFGGQMIALFACEQSAIHQRSGLIPCIHALGLRQLLLLYNSGVEYLLIATEDCTHCARSPQSGIYQRLEQLNALLIERNKPPLKIMQRSSQVWLKVFRTDEMISRGTRLPRREFLRGGRQLLRHQWVVLDPLNLPECRTIPPGHLLPAVKSEKVHWPWAPRLDESRCNGCDACFRLCPTDALQLVRDDEEATRRYQVIPAGCIGCGVCVAVCESQAITVHSWSLAVAHSVNLLEKRCTNCGGLFHVPEKNQIAGEACCRICQKHNHNQNLFQVLDVE